MRDHPNCVVVRSGYEALARRDAAALASVLPEPLSGLADTLFDGDEFAGTLTPLAMAAANDLVVVIDRLCGRGGRALDCERVSIYRVNGGRIVEARRY